MRKDTKNTEKLSDEELMDLMGGYGADIASGLADKAYQSFKMTLKYGIRPGTKYGVAPKYGIPVKYGIGPILKYGIKPMYGTWPQMDYGVIPR